VEHDISKIWIGIRIYAKWEKYIVLKRMNELDKCDKKPWHSYKELNKSMSK
jgi:hypothetical protein